MPVNLARQRHNLRLSEPVGPELAMHVMLQVELFIFWTFTGLPIFSFLQERTSTILSAGMD